MRVILSQNTIARVARMYRTNHYAAEALGICPSSFGRLCRRFKIETPDARRRRRHRENRERWEEHRERVVEREHQRLATRRIQPEGATS